MKIEKNLELLKKAINERQDLKINLDSEGFGIFKFDKENNCYRNKWGYLDLKSIVIAYKHQVKNENYFIKLSLIDE